MYKGFQYAGRLPSIQKQRILQKEFLDNIDCTSKCFLQAGVGDGYETNVLFQSNFFKKCTPKVYLCDIDLSFLNISHHNFISNYSGQINQISCSISELNIWFNEPTFDVIQVGFVMHDIEHPKEKDEIFSSLYSILNPKGKLIFSDSFIDKMPTDNSEYEMKRKERTIVLYDFFIGEANECLKHNLLMQNEFDALLGNGNNDGIMKTQKDAANGMRDYYEDVNTTIGRMKLAGFSIKSVINNPVYDVLKIIIAEK